MLAMCRWYCLGGHTKINLKASIALSHRGGTITGIIATYYYGFLFSIVVNSIAWFVISTVVNKYYWNYTGVLRMKCILSQNMPFTGKRTHLKKHDILIKPSIKVNR